MQQVKPKLSTEQRIGATLLTIVALIVLPASVQFLIRHSHRFGELDGMRRWSFAVMLAAITLVALWALVVIVGMSAMAVRFLRRRLALGGNRLESPTHTQ
jgi:hypothetical protein